MKALMLAANLVSEGVWDDRAGSRLVLVPNHLWGLWTSGGRTVELSPLEVARLAGEGRAS